MNALRQVHSADGWTLTEHEITDQREGHRQSRLADHNLRVGDDLTVSTGRWSVLYRRVDRVSGWYHEWVIDPETRQPIHHRYEPLPDHTDHGSAKRQDPDTET